MSLEFHTHPDFVHILRILNTNVDGKRKVEVAIQDIRGVGYRYARLACKKADIDPAKRAGELTQDEVSKIVAILQQPQQFKIPQWFVNRQKDFKDGKYKHLTANALDAAIREDLERLKKIRAHRGLRHCWNLKCRGQHTKTTGRHGRTVGVSTKKK